MRTPPTYDLTTFQALFPQCGITTTTASADALALGFSSNDIDEVIRNLTTSDFYKTMPSEKKPGLWQDVYRPKHLGVDLYVKIQVSGNNTKAVLVSFKAK